MDVLPAVLAPGGVHGVELVAAQEHHGHRERSLRELRDEGADQELLERGRQRLEVVEDQEHPRGPRDRRAPEAEHLARRRSPQRRGEIGDERVRGDVVEVVLDARPVGGAEHVAERAGQRGRGAQRPEAGDQPPRVVDGRPHLGVHGVGGVEELLGLGHDLVEAPARLEQRQRGELDLRRRRPRVQLRGDRVHQRSMDARHPAQVGEVVTLRARRRRQALPRELPVHEREEVPPRLLVGAVHGELQPPRLRRLVELEDVPQQVRLADPTRPADADDAQARGRGLQRRHQPRHLGAAVSVVAHRQAKALAAPWAAVSAAGTGAAGGVSPRQVLSA